MRRGIGVLGGLTAALFLVCLLGLWTLLVAVSPSRYVAHWNALDVYPIVGIAPEDGEQAAQAIADTLLSGDVAPMEQLRLTVRGEMQPAFNAREIAHMRDVGAMFRFWPVVAALALFSMCDLFAMIFVLRMPELRAAWRRGALVGAGCVVALIGAVAVWAAIDFSSIFTLFHRVSFTNDLWLLDPATDLLIRLLPLEFFIRTVGSIAAFWLASGMAVLGAFRLFARIKEDA